MSNTARVHNEPPSRFSSNQVSQNPQPDLPFEIKSLIYHHTDLETFKSLRLVCSSWAKAGHDFIILPTFNVRNFERAMKRLDAFSQGNLNRKAVNTIDRICIGSSTWDTMYLQNFASDDEGKPRHLRSDWLCNAPEREAILQLQEIASSPEEFWSQSVDTLKKSVSLSPIYQEMRIRFPHMSDHIVLRHARYQYEKARSAGFLEGILPYNLKGLVETSNNIGLKVRHFYHSLIAPGALPMFARIAKDAPTSFEAFLSELQSLHLVFNEPPHNLVYLFNSTLKLQSLSLTSRMERPYLGMDYLGLPHLPCLHSLSISGIPLYHESLDHTRGLSCYFKGNGRSVRNFSLATLTHSHGTSFHDVLRTLRDEIGSRLEKVQFIGWFRDGGRNRRFFLLPIYKPDWTVETRFEYNSMTKRYEDYVIRGGEWPSRSPKAPAASPAAAFPPSDPSPVM